MTLMLKNRKQNGFRLIPPDLHGIVDSRRLAEIFQCSYQTIWNRMKAGHIIPIANGKRNKEWDLDDLRRQLGQPDAPMPTARHKQNTPAPDPEQPQEEPVEEHQTVDETETPKPKRTYRRRKKDPNVAEAVGPEPAPRAIAEAFVVAKTAFRRKIRAAAARAAQAGDTESELALLRMYAHCGPAFDAVRAELTGDQGVH